MTCKHLHFYNPTGSKWTVASCVAKSAPYVPSTFELNTFCRNSQHAVCPSFLFPDFPRRQAELTTEASPGNQWQAG